MTNPLSKSVNYWYILSIFYLLVTLFVLIFYRSTWFWYLTLFLSLSTSFCCWFHQTRPFAVRLINLGLFWGIGYLIFQPFMYSPVALSLDLFLCGFLCGLLFIGKLRKDLQRFVSQLIVGTAFLCLFIPFIYSIFIDTIEIVLLFYPQYVRTEILPWLEFKVSLRIPVVLILMAPSFNVVLTGKYPSWGLFQGIAQTFSEMI